MSQKEFSTDWFSGNAPNWSKHLAELKGRASIRGLEIGVFQGRSTCWLLENIFTHESARLEAVDTFEGSDENADLDPTILNSLYDVFRRNVAEYGGRSVAHRMKSSQFLRSSSDSEKYDFIYVDGDHHSWAALEDMVLCWPLFKVGGIMIIDDYGTSSDSVDLPKAGVDAFLHAFKTRYSVLYAGYQVILKKLF